ncbi:hypothetical protein TRIATDRAFT_299470 [Trichoderma atroviride IMI 206040]|uniref:Uncharacterized protein n=1 Tax=Hypocrea atroviridis (strain ATCC 20476 / IMI 206040) TaxID=452589 RepID=G9NT37_HYPAI|nr:uncharacterized protein TRIATDRAFT_299470 [Trichoderma atroviride IMI 206040]EHK45886.1 hypothetical protein TRIATDRAFT_299470 [Trichoderma atroviride IMI 206040]
MIDTASDPAKMTEGKQKAMGGKPIRALSPYRLMGNSICTPGPKTRTLICTPEGLGHAGYLFVFNIHWAELLQEKGWGRGGVYDIATLENPILARGN